MSLLLIVDNANTVLQWPYFKKTFHENHFIVERKGTILHICWENMMMSLGYFFSAERNLA